MNQLLHPSSARRAFTLIELLVVMGIIVILVAVSAPALKALSKSNGTASAANQVRAFLSNARALAISQHTEIGVVFFEQTANNSTNGHYNQTAMQICYADPNQGQYGTLQPGTTVFIPFSNDIQYLSNGLQVATLAQDSTGGTAFAAAGNTSVPTLRAVIFGPDGQLELRAGAAVPASGQTNYSKSLADWNFLKAQAAIPANNPTSAGALVIYNAADYRAENLASDTDRTSWLQKNATILVINAYTGGIIQ